MENLTGWKLTFTQIWGWFKVEEDRHLESNINVKNQAEGLKNFVQRIKDEVAQMKKLKEAVDKDIEQYNRWVDLMTSAMNECGLAKDEKKIVEALKKIDEQIKIIVEMDEEKMPK